MRYRGVLLFFLVLCAGNLSAAQRTFVSAANGNDTNPCTRPLPCRSFAAALLFTDADGEVIVVDSGGYGPVTITQSVSLISPKGVYAGITAPSARNAITVSAGDSAHIVLKNLDLNAQGADIGISAGSAAELSVEGCRMTAFKWGISFVPTTPGARLYVSDSVIRRSSFNGIHVAGSVVGVQAMIDSTRLLQNNNGFYIYNAHVTIRGSEASGAATHGFWLDLGSTTAIEDTVSAANTQLGFYSTGGIATLMRCTVTSNGSGGVFVTNGGTIYVSDSTITANYHGVSALPGASVMTRGNNTLQGNNTNQNGVFTGSFPAQ